MGLCSSNWKKNQIGICRLTFLDVDKVDKREVCGSDRQGMFFFQVGKKYKNKTKKELF